jgi:hypothetical protein
MLPSRGPVLGCVNRILLSLFGGYLELKTCQLGSRKASLEGSPPLELLHIYILQVSMRLRRERERPTSLLVLLRSHLHSLILDAVVVGMY